MKHLQFVATTALVALSLFALPRAVEAQGQVRMVLPAVDPFPAAPEILVHASSFADSTAPRRVRLRLALDAGLGLIVFDSTITNDDPRFTTIKLLPENRDIFAEATVFDRAGRTLATVIELAGHTGPRLQLVSPNASTGVTFFTRRPTFVWRSARVTFPPGPWVYQLSVTETASLKTNVITGIMDTSFTYPTDLDASTPYKWTVVARLANGLALDSAVAKGNSTFTILPSDAVVKTLVYQNFPNPFPAPSSQTTCVWFDLKSTSNVELSIHDLRGHRVRTLIPGLLPGILPAGRYGRASELTGGCDARLRWDGTADDGRTVPAGVYLLRFKPDGEKETMKKIVFLGY